MISCCNLIKLRAWVFGALLVIGGAVHAATSDAPVVIHEDATTFTLDNGILSARVLKARGDLISLTYKGIETLTDGSGHAFAYWSHDARGAERLITRISIDPNSNDGARGEVSIKAISGGRRMGHGPGAPAGGDFPADIEIRYTLARGDSALFTYSIFNHPPQYGAGSMVEARFAAKLDPMFDHIHVDARRQGRFPLYGEGEDKYIYTALQSENRAYGWTSPARQLGWFLLNPSVEYLSGGPTKPEFLAHGASTVLNYWRSSHYGGANVPVNAGEAWTKVIGPFALYVNEGATSQAMWEDAKQRLEAEKRAWPYAWVNAPEYVPRERRAAVRGELVLRDAIEPAANRFIGAVHVGLAKLPFEGLTERGMRTISWQRDAKHYQFWTRQERSGAFHIPNVVPGEYTLYAFADGVLGEYSRAKVRLEPGQQLDLGTLIWQPVRRGQMMWEVGVANRTALEFSHAEKFFEPGVQLRYAESFPNDVRFTIGESNPAQDWFFAHVPHATDLKSPVVPFRGVRGTGRATPYTIVFDSDRALSGQATLRLAICGTGAKHVEIAVNGRDAGRVSLGSEDGVITRHQIQGLWYERELTFDASLISRGENTLTLTIPAGSLNAGVIYDYLRLEVAAESPLAFPGAEGAGRFSLGGRGGAVLKVTNLNDSGPGSLRAAVEASGPRTVIFDVAGTIELTRPLVISTPRITIAGQSAPGDGVTLRNQALVIAADDVIVRYLRSRLGDTSATQDDAISVNAGRRIMLDHVSASWSIDEVLSVSADYTRTANAPQDVTVQWSIISESLNASGHDKGRHGYGTLTRGGRGSKFSYHHNLWASHGARMPRPGNYTHRATDPEGAFFDFRNNVFYNWGGEASGYNADTESLSSYNFIGNAYIPGPNTKRHFAFKESNPFARAYFAANAMDGRVPADPWSLVTGVNVPAHRLASEIEMPPVTTEAWDVAYRRVLDDAGASHRRDAVDARVVAGVQSREHRIIDSQKDVGGWPVIAAATPARDSDGDGIPDVWEQRLGFDPAKADANDDADGDGYTNLEAYLHAVIDESATRLPKLIIVGDSTAARGASASMGWGEMIGDYFDPAHVEVINRARGGRSSRTYITEGLWDKVLADLEAGDTVLIQFGHNDGGPRNGPRVARASLPGLGEETEHIDNVVTQRPETLHTFGWYLRKMIADARAKGATPVLLSLTVRNVWRDGRVERGSGRYGEWSRDVALAQRTAFIDLTQLIADRYERLGHEAVNGLFPRDPVHTGIDGARLNASLVVSGLKALREQSLIGTLSLTGRAAPTAAPSYVHVPRKTVPADKRSSAFDTWLNLPEPADPKLPTLWLIGDSTVRTGRGDGSNGQFGWGDAFERYVHPARANLVNRAVGGLGARTFRDRWEQILPQVKQGDFVIMQFGHNDNGARGALAGVGAQSKQRVDAATNHSERVHTFGEYVRRYVAEVRAKGAIPIIGSLVPRNRWDGATVIRTRDRHADWARLVAKQEQVAFIDLHERIAIAYEALGKEATTALFADGMVHTNWEGAKLNARIVFEALRELPESPLSGYLRPM